jgi:hypothetical protein
MLDVVIKELLKLLENMSRIQKQEDLVVEWQKAFVTTIWVVPYIMKLFQVIPITSSNPPFVDKLYRDF